MPEPEQLLLNEVEPIVAGLGFQLVELRFGRSTKQTHLSVCIYHPDGVGINDCAVVSRTLKPRLELLEGLDDLRLEVSSPGIDRTLKDRREYDIFTGKGVRLKIESDWLGGVLDGTTPDAVILRQGSGRTPVPFKQIKKAKLDYSQEE